MSEPINIEDETRLDSSLEETIRRLIRERNSQYENAMFNHREAMRLQRELDAPRSGPDGRRWHKLSEITVGGIAQEILGATCEEGIGVIARWVRLDGDMWEVEAIDTESGGWDLVAIFNDEDDIIPPSPPTIWDDRN
jgi:hypothetical protein